jgi:benzoyl-CoA reductase/2-hydroxyglutaryl-CoA dehydratase subunit BcrC/BadD/HgdB
MSEATVAIPHRLEVIRAHRAAGGGVVAVLPIHDPRALLRAFGLLPVEVWGPPKADASQGAAHLQPYVCSIVRNALSFLLSGGLEATDGLLVPHACDSLQGLGSVLIDFVHPRQAVLPFYLPRGHRSLALDFLAQELRALHDRLRSLTGLAPAEGALLECITREEEADALLAALHAQRAALPLTTAEFYRLIRAREFLPAEQFAELARGALALPPRAPDARVPVVFSGIVPEPAQMLEAIDRMGASVVADDFAGCGRRLYPPGTDSDPFRRLAHSLLAAGPDPTLGSPIADRLSHLTQLTRRSGARGVIFYDVKFCEPELFDLPLLRAGLQQAGIPSTSVEIDLSDPLPEQTLTRIGAFLEMIS